MENKKRDTWSNEITNKEGKQKKTKKTKTKKEQIILQIILQIHHFLFDIKQ